MGDFFYGWRRKVGSLTLLLACMFMIGWSRSLCLYNKVEFPIGTQVTSFVVSTKQFVGCGMTFDEHSTSEWNFHECNAQVTLPLNTTVEDEGRNPLWYSRNLEWVSEWHGFGTGVCFDEFPDYWRMEWMIPYWSIVIPLMLISLWLLLFMTRKSVQRKISEPTLKRVA